MLSNRIVVDRGGLLGVDVNSHGYDPSVATMRLECCEKRACSWWPQEWKDCRNSSRSGVPIATQGSQAGKARLASALGLARVVPSGHRVRLMFRLIDR